MGTKQFLIAKSTLALHVLEVMSRPLAQLPLAGSSLKLRMVRGSPQATALSAWWFMVSGNPMEETQLGHSSSLLYSSPVPPWAAASFLQLELRLQRSLPDRKMESGRARAGTGQQSLWGGQCYPIGSHLGPYKLHNAA